MYTIYNIYVALYNFFTSIVINIITRAIAQGGKNGHGQKLLEKCLQGSGRNF